MVGARCGEYLPLNPSINFIVKRVLPGILGFIFPGIHFSSSPIQARESVESYAGP